MTVQHREEHVEVVSTTRAAGRPVVLGVSAPVATTEYQTETVTRDPYAGQRGLVARLQQLIYLLFGILEALLGIRFVLGLLGANPAAGFAQFIYGSTAPFLAPFVGLFGEPRFEGSVFEWNALVAILVYALLAGVLAKVVALLLGNIQGGTYTSTSRHIDRT